HAATLLPNGRVRVVGGYGNSGILTSAEEYDPAANGGNGNWAPPTDGLRTARLYHTATFLSNGKVLVVGGYTNTSTGNAIASAELFDPAVGAWRTTGSLTTARLYHTATLLPNGKVLVVGGSTSTNGNVGSPLASAELFDPTADGGVGSWTPTLQPLATARVFHTATLLPNGKVLVAGGQFSGSCAELYDPAANGGNGDWSTTGCLTTGRAGHTATLLQNGTVLVAGGTSSALATTETFDPAANGGVGAWGATGSLTTHRYRHTATLLPTGKVLVVGGSPDGGISGSLASAELYDPAVNGGVGPWTPTLQPLTTGRQNHTATLLPNGKVLVVGGSTDGVGGFLANAELFQ
ncbi:MAG: kelch repeat-containing protein, partial [Nitrospira sp.]